MRTLLLVCMMSVGALYSPFLTHAALEVNWEIPEDGAVVAGVAIVRGWAIGAQEVVMTIDGGAQLHLPCCSERPDVAVAKGPDALMSGFGGTFNWGELKEGEHALTLEVRGRTETVVKKRTVRVVKVFGNRFTNGEVFVGDVILPLGDKIALLSSYGQQDGQRSGRLTILAWDQGSQSFQVVESQVMPTVTFNGATPFIEEKVKASVGFLWFQHGFFPKDFTVNVVDNPTDQFSRSDPQAITLNIGHPQWKRANPVQRLEDIFHEVMLLWEHQLVGDAGLYREGSDQRPFGGPVWLLAGMARCEGDMLVAQLAGGTLEDIKQMRHARAEGSAPLSSLQSWDQMANPGYDQNLSRSALAACSLDPDGESLFVKYLQQIAGGAPPEQAFQSAFGQDLASFEANN